MTPVHTVSLELLRPGPAHNQLLSPLTPYCAVCDDRDATTVYLPFEHRQFLAMFRALCRLRGRDPQADGLADALGRILGSMPSLLSAVSSQPAGADGLTQLRLILSASELALLPFELAVAPAGFPAAGRALFRQIQQPLSITREVRGARATQYDWGRPPRILVISANTPGLPDVPLRPHLLALHNAVSRWRTLPSSRKGRGGSVDHLLKVLPNATLAEVRAACQADDFTHIHILAHGQTVQVGSEERFGVSLCGRWSGSEVVGGEDLAAALRVRDSQGRMSSPLWVTLCTCDSGQQGSVLLPGGSIAHALQDAGIPWVLASQLPLSMYASVLLTQELYPGLLAGRDPRLLVSSLRQTLHSDCPATYDWASLVLYAAVAPDFADQLRCALRLRVHEAVGLLFHQAEALSVTDVSPAPPMASPAAAPPLSADPTPTGPQWEPERLPSEADLTAELDRCRRELGQAMPEGRSSDPKVARERGEVLGLLGSLERNRAFLLCRQGSQRRDVLEQARQYYLQAAQADLSSLWCAVHFVSISAVLGRLPDELVQRWLRAALTQAELYLFDETVEKDIPRSVRGRLALVELNLLACLAQASSSSASLPAPPPAPPPAPLPEHAQQALRHAQEIAHLATQFPKEVQRLARRLRRYQYEAWWDRSVERSGFDRALAEVLARFPSPGDAAG